MSALPAAGVGLVATAADTRKARERRGERRVLFTEANLVGAQAHEREPEEPVVGASRQWTAAVESRHFISLTRGADVVLRPAVHRFEGMFEDNNQRIKEGMR